jgi:hypothetical protein
LCAVDFFVDDECAVVLCFECVWLVVAASALGATRNAATTPANAVLTMSFIMESDGTTDRVN